MKLKKVSVVVACGAVALMMVSAAQAKTTKAAKVVATKTNPMAELPRFTQPEFEWKELARKYNDIDASSAYRNLAQTGEPTFSADYLELKRDLDEAEGLARQGRNERNLDDQTKDFVYQAAVKFDALLVKWAARAAPGGKVADSKLSNDTRFVVAHLLPLVEMKSLVPRLVKIVMPARVIRQSTVEQIQDGFSDMKLYFPKNSWEASFAYVSEPMEGMGPEFANEAAFQAHMSDRVYARIQQGLELLENIGPMDPSKPVGRDNRLVYGLDAFGTAPGDRYFLLRDADRLAAIARMARQQYEISLGSVYNNNCTVSLAQHIGTLYGVEVAKSTLSLRNIVATVRGQDTQILAPTRKEHVDTVKELQKATPGCFKKNPNAAAHVNNAIQSLRKSVSYGYWTWSTLAGASNYSSPLIDPGFFKGRKDEARVYFGNISKAAGVTNLVRGFDYGNNTYISMMSGKPVKVDYLNFLRNLPDDSSDLLPDDFAGDRGYFNRTLSTGKIQVRNWGRSRAIRWKASVYGALFPDLAAQAAKDPNGAGAAVPEYVRNWTESRGGTSISEFVHNFVR